MSQEIKKDKLKLKNKINILMLYCLKLCNLQIKQISKSK